MTQPNRPLDAIEAESLERLQRVLWDLREYLKDLVVVGGWVPALHRLYGGFARWESSLSRTSEVDVMVHDEMPPAGRRPIPAILAEAGFAPAGAGPSFAVWRGDPATGEQIEFLVALVGPYGDLGTVRPIAQQQSLGAIQLPRLQILRQFTQVLLVPVHPLGQRTRVVRVTVPLLGTFAITRGTILFQRGRAAGGEKPVKDLLYLHDILAAGSDVVARVEQDIRTIVRDSMETREYAAYAANQVKLVLTPESPLLRDAAIMLAEREGLSLATSQATLVGYLGDFVEIIEEQMTE